MKYLLFGGAPQTGKTGTITRLASKLLSPSYGFVIINHINYPPVYPNVDFKLVIEGVDCTGKKIRVYINSATDTKKIIIECKKYYDANLPIDIVISSVRDIFKVRNDFFNIMKIDTSIDEVIEIPLAKVRKGTYRASCLVWYEDKIDKISKSLLKNNPFNL